MPCSRLSTEAAEQAAAINSRSFEASMRPVREIVREPRDLCQTR